MLTERALELRAQGKLYREIADELGISMSAANRLCDPAVKERHRARTAVRNRDRLRRRRCDRCDRPCYGLMCRECRNEQAQIKAMAFHRFWNAGLKLPEIAERMGINRRYAGSLLSKYRQMGFGLPYRSKS